jgi:2-dehydro-3-deoxyphosphogluconate aldolase/(4S)-4-hydroxy-2-oxoglutarate aldolase
MTKQKVLGRIAEIGVVPVVRAPSPHDALRALDAICEGGVTILEITMTVPGAIGVIETAAASRGQEVIVGAGTVLDVETARACVDAGARFIVSPSLDLATIDYCVKASIAVLPGALTPTEVMTAWRAGADVVKVFPCGSVGGANYIRALKAPLPQIPLLPTGGVSITTAADFIKAGAFALGVGSDLVDVDAIARGDARQVTERARMYVHLVREARSARPFSGS